MTEIQTAPKRSFFTNVFISPDEQRLRAGWRLLIQTILMIVIAIPFGLMFIIASFLLPVTGKSFLLASDQLISLLSVGLSIFISRRWLDKRSFTSLGFQWNQEALKDIFLGIGITFLQMGFIYLAMNALGWIKFENFAWNIDPLPPVLKNILFFFVVFVFVGWNEELLSRGYHMQTLASGLNLTWGIIISSAVFGLLHLGNPGATWVSTLGIFFAGIFLAYGYVRTRQLWLSIGLHIGWNFFEGVVFGFPVSGLDIYPLMKITVNGPILWTGGAFGPEAGLIVLPALFIGVVLIYWVTRNRENSKNN